MTTFKKLAALLIAGVMVTAMGSGVFAGVDESNSMYSDLQILRAKYADCIDITSLEECISGYLANEDYKQFYSESREDCINAIGNGLSARADAQAAIKAREGGPIECYRYVPNLTQITPWCCGATAVVQALGGKSIAGYDRYMSQQDSIPLQEAMINSLGIGVGVSPAPYQLVNQLNAKLGSNTYSAVYIGSNTTEAEIATLMGRSLTNNYIPILNAQTAGLDYYNGHTSGHYVAVRYVHTGNLTVKVMDCNNNLTYNGDKSTTCSEVKAALYGRFLIIAS